MYEPKGPFVQMCTSDVHNFTMHRALPQQRQKMAISERQAGCYYYLLAEFRSSIYTEVCTTQ